MEGVLDQGSKKLLFFTREILAPLQVCQVHSQRIAGRLVLKLERAQIKEKARNYFLVH